ncbi:hypothetical protein JYU15_01425 [bacterium AH-315-I18]|nr:hypothetical protein [Phycisphaeraceae bacterium]MBN4061074.1 hypothetical protein [bacterium AH-315-I18]
MMLKPSDSYTAQFTTQHPDTAVATNADSLPVAIATRNGTDDAGFVLTVTNMTIGRYKITSTIPVNYIAGDLIQITIQATVATIAATAIVDHFTIDTKRNSDLNDFNASTQFITVDNITNNALAEFFTTNSGVLFNSAVAGSVVKEVVDNVVIAISNDWTTAEQEQIRYRLGIDGTASTPVATGDLSDIKTILQAATHK